MSCIFCREPIKLDDDFFHVRACKGSHDPSHMYRCGWWDFHVKCWHDMMKRCNCNPEIPFPTFDEDPIELERELINVLGEQMATAINEEIVEELIKKYKE